MKKNKTDLQNLLEVLCRSLSEAIVFVNEEQEVIFSNDAANSLLNIKDGEWSNQNINLVISENDFLKAVPETSEPCFIEIKIEDQEKNSKSIHLQASFKQLEFQDEVYFMYKLDPSQPEKQAFEMNRKSEDQKEEGTSELRQIITELKDEILRRKEAESKIKAALDKERELNELKTKFLSLVSHEFKTPLSVILSSASLAEKYTTTEQQDKREKHLNNIKLKVRSLNNILNDFLSIERIQSGKSTYHLEDFPLSRVINDVIYDANMLSKKGQKIHYPENIDGIVVHFDEKILELTLTNLINNSIKYSPENSNITLSVEEKGENLFIHVKDEGIGITEKEQKFIFNPYFRAENVLLKQGTGIGLNIVKGHLKNLNGQVSFVSKEGEGSIFSISIPYKNKK